MVNRKRNIQMKFWVTEEEKRLIEEKMAQLHTKRSCAPPLTGSCLAAPTWRICSAASSGKGMN